MAVAEKPVLMPHAERRRLIEAPLPSVRYIHSNARHGGGRGNQRLVDAYQNGFARLSWRHAPNQPLRDDTAKDVGR